MVDILSQRLLLLRGYALEYVSHRGKITQHLNNNTNSALITVIYIYVTRHAKRDLLGIFWRKMRFLFCENVHSIPFLLIPSLLKYAKARPSNEGMKYVTL